MINEWSKEEQVEYNDYITDRNYQGEVYQSAFYKNLVNKVPEVRTLSPTAQKAILSYRSPLPTMEEYFEIKKACMAAKEDGGVALQNMMNKFFLKMFSCSIWGEFDETVLLEYHELVHDVLRRMLTLETGQTPSMIRIYPKHLSPSETYRLMNIAILNILKNPPKLPTLEQYLEAKSVNKILY